MKEKSLAWSLTFLWCLLFTLVSLCSSMMIALQNVTWSKVDAQAKFLIIIGIVAGWGNTMMAFISKQAHRIEEGKPLINGGDTTFLSKADAPPNPPEKKP